MQHRHAQGMCLEVKVLLERPAGSSGCCWQLVVTMLALPPTQPLKRKKKKRVTCPCAWSHHLTMENLYVCRDGFVLYSAEAALERLGCLMGMCEELQLDAILLVGGIDGGFVPEAAQLLSWLLFGCCERQCFRVTVPSMTTKPGAADCLMEEHIDPDEDGLDEIVVCLRRDGATHVWVPNHGYARILDHFVMAQWPHLTVSSPPAGCIDTDVNEALKVAAFVDMCHGCGKIGTPLGPPGTAAMQIEKWPLVQAYALETTFTETIIGNMSQLDAQQQARLQIFLSRQHGSKKRDGGGGFFTMTKTVVNLLQDPSYLERRIWSVIDLQYSLVVRKSLLPRSLLSACIDTACFFTPDSSDSSPLAQYIAHANTRHGPPGAPAPQVTAGGSLGHSSYRWIVPSKVAMIEFADPVFRISFKRTVFFVSQEEAETTSWWIEPLQRLVSLSLQTRATFVKSRSMLASSSKTGDPSTHDLPAVTAENDSFGILTADTGFPSAKADREAASCLRCCATDTVVFQPCTILTGGIPPLLMHDETMLRLRKQRISDASFLSVPCHVYLPCLEAAVGGASASPYTGYAHLTEASDAVLYAAPHSVDGSDRAAVASELYIESRVHGLLRIADVENDIYQACEAIVSDDVHYLILSFSPSFTGTRAGWLGAVSLALRPSGFIASSSLPNPLRMLIRLRGPSVTQLPSEFMYLAPQETPPHIFSRDSIGGSAAASEKQGVIVICGQFAADRDAVAKDILAAAAAADPDHLPRLEVSDGVESARAVVTRLRSVSGLVPQVVVACLTDVSEESDCRDHITRGFVQRIVLLSPGAVFSDFIKRSNPECRAADVDDILAACAADEFQRHQRLREELVARVPVEAPSRFAKHEISTRMRLRAPAARPPSSTPGSFVVQWSVRPAAGLARMEDGPSVVEGHIVTVIVDRRHPEVAGLLPSGGGSSGGIPSDENVRRAEEGLVRAWIRESLVDVKLYESLKNLNHAGDGDRISPVTLSVSQEEKESLRKVHLFDPLPDGWFFNGSAYVDFEGHSSRYHPLMDSLVAQYMQQRMLARQQLLLELTHGSTDPALADDLC